MTQTEEPLHHGTVSLAQEDKAEPIDYSSAEYDYAVADEVEESIEQTEGTNAIPQADPFL